MAQGVSLFIPVYNAAIYLRQAIKKSHDSLSKLGCDFEVIIVDDNSNDETYRFRQVIEQGKYEAGKTIRYLFDPQGPSRRENLAKSFNQAKYETIAFIDVDLSCDISFLIQAIHLLNEQKPDIVIGSRYIKGAKAERRIVRKILSFFYNLTIRLLFQSRILDHQCGLKVFRKDAAMPVIKAMGYDHTYTRGWFWDAEFLIRAQKAHLDIIEMPVKWRYARTSTFNLFREWKCIAAMIRLKSELNRKK